MGEYVQLTNGTISETKASSVDVIDSDLTMPDNNHFDDWEVEITLNKYTRDGDNFNFCEKGDQLVADATYRWRFSAKNTDAFNLQAVSGTDLGFTGIIRGVRGA